jgi:tRNA-modifying protein YgfZ
MTGVGAGDGAGAGTGLVAGVGTGSGTGLDSGHGPDPGSSGGGIPPPLPVEGCTTEEVRLLTEGCVLIEAPWETVLEVTGAEAGEFLHSMLTQDITGMKDGDSRPAALADRKGHWLADLWVLRCRAGYFVRIRRDLAPSFLAVLDRHLFSSRVSWQESTAGGSSMLLLGRDAGATWQRLDGVREAGISDAAGGGRLTSAAGGEVPGWWMRVEDSGETGVLLHAPQIALRDLRARILSPSDRGAGVQAVGASLYNLARIGGGMPWHGLDGGAERLVPEVVPPDRISLTKGCFVGQETMARVYHRGQLRRRLVRAWLDSRTVPAVGTPILGSDGAPAGELRSAALHPDGYVIGLVLRSEPVRGAAWSLAGGEAVSWSEPPSGTTTRW